MAVFGINDGHTKSGVGCGAVGIINESVETRKVGQIVRQLLAENGHKVVDCTVDYSTSVSDNLSHIVSIANRQDLDWFVSIHFNAGGGRGVEVYTYEGRQYQDALDVCSNIAALGFQNRGVKAGSGLYVIRRTSAKSMLIEVCFVDTDDANKYKEVGAYEIALAIVKALIGEVKKVSNETSVNHATTILNAGTLADFVRNLQEEINAQGFGNLKVDSIPGPKTLAACPTLRQGAKGNITKLVQKELIRRGYEGITVNGVFDASFANVVKRFQGYNGLKQDAIIGEKSWSNLLGLD